MAAHRYWRLTAFAVPGAGALELSEVRFYAGGSAVDAGATLSCAFVPSVGQLSDLKDGVATAFVSWPSTAHRSAGFSLVWDFGIGESVSPDYLRLGGGSSSLSYPQNLTVQWSDNSMQWTTTNLVAWAAFAGPFTLTASDAVDTLPTALVFSKVNDIDYTDYLPPSLTDLTELFSSDTGQFTKYTEGLAGTTAVSGAKMTVTHSGGKNDIIKQNEVGITLPQVWVECQVTVVNTSGTGYDNGGVGIVKDQNNFLFASMDRLASNIRIQIKIAGVNTFLASVAQLWGTSFKLALSLVGTSVCVYTDTGTGWAYKTGADVRAYFDFRTTGVLAGWGAGYTLANGSGTSVWAFSSLKMGRFGAVGIRDQTVVTFEDGAPKIAADKVLFSATATDPRGEAYCGVFEIDLDARTVRQTSVIFVQRSGKSCNDLSAHIIWYADGRRRMLISTWANGFGGVIQTLHGLFTVGDVLSGTNLVTMTAVMLPGQSGANPGAYDAVAVYDSANTRWLVAYTLVDNTSFAGNVFYPAACHTADFSSFTLIGKDSANPGYEGTKILRMRGNYYIAAGGPAGAGTSARVYTAAMTYEGTLGVIFNGGSSTQPHPMMIPYRGQQLLLTFDDSKYGSSNFTWGNIQIFEANRSLFGDSANQMWRQALGPSVSMPGDMQPTGAAREHIAPIPFFDAYNGGLGIVTGSIKEKNTPASTPLRRRVLLIDEASRMTIRETWSDAITGNYEFRGVKQGVKYTVISYDHLHNYRAVIADNQDAT